MQNYEETEKAIDLLAGEETLAEIKEKTFVDYIALALTTFGVGYIPLAPGPWGSAVGVLIYLLVARIERNTLNFGVEKGWKLAPMEAWRFEFSIIFFFLLTFIGIWAAGRAVILFRNKDPQQAVVDEVAGQFLTFLFVPLELNWTLVIAGFLLFRLFDIWKPYPIDDLQALPTGLGVVADDLLAGVYAGTCLALLNALLLTI